MRELPVVLLEDCPFRGALTTVNGHRVRQQSIKTPKRRQRQKRGKYALRNRDLHFRETGPCSQVLQLRLRKPAGRRRLQRRDRLRKQFDPTVRRVCDYLFVRETTVIDCLRAGGMPEG
jgi:hypothetical protein